MAQPRPRYQKLVEFVAHASDVRCVRIGRKTSGVLATGGDDHKVNVWAIGRTTVTVSLAGHTSSVESVTFDRNEEVVASGACSGSIKTFELQTGKVSRSLSGHKSNISCLEFHPYHNTLLSGSMDTNLKHWDLRVKDAIMTLKGHATAVTHAKYSPDGRWVASASQDGAVKIWDLTAGKALADLCPATRMEVTGLEYHPFEFLLATSARDKVIRLWDLETFKCVEQSPVEASQVRNIAFHQDGRHTFSILQDGMKVWSWEPATCHDYVDVPWYRVADFATRTHHGQQQILGCSFNSNMVGMFNIKLRSIRPFCDDDNFMAGEGPSSSMDAGMGLGGAGPYGDGIGRTSSQPLPLPPVAPDGALRNMNLNSRLSAPPVPLALPAPPPAPLGASGWGAQPAPAGPPRYSGAASAMDKGSGMQQPPLLPVLPPAPAAGRYPPAAANQRYAPAPSGSSQEYGTQADMGSSQAASSAAPQGRPPEGPRPSATLMHMVSIGVGVGDSLMRGNGPPLAQQQQQGAQGPGEPSGHYGGGMARSRSQNDPQRGAQGRDAAVGNEGQGYGQGPAYQQPPRREPSPPVMPGPPSSYGEQRYQPSWSPPPEPAGPSEQQPSGMQGGGRGGQAPQQYQQQYGGANGNASGGAGGFPGTSSSSSSASDHVAMQELQRRHGEMRAALALRANSLALLRNFVTRGDWRGAIGCARRCNDPGTLPDLLAVMQAHKDAYHLSLVGEIAAVADAVLSLPADRAVSLALDVIAVQLHAFGQLIQECSAPLRGGVGIDLKFQERRDTAGAAKLALSNLVPKLNTVGRRPDDLGVRAKDLAVQVAQL